MSHPFQALLWLFWSGLFAALTDSPSGYDFGYLLKILTCEPLPQNENDFFQLLYIWFPCIYDIKHVVRSVKTLRGGLQEIAESLGVSWCSFFSM